MAKFTMYTMNSEEEGRTAKAETETLELLQGLGDRNTVSNMNPF